MEPVWPTGQSEIFVDRFLDMIARGPSQSVAYAQLGQENSFGWPAMRQAYPMQMEKLARVRHTGGLHVETMGETGRRFKRAFRSTPAQAQVMLEDPLGRTDAPERTVWYQSKFLRANLHFRGTEFYLRDLHVYDDRFPQPYLTEPVRQHGIEQRLLAVLDGYHWSDEKVRAGQEGRRALGPFRPVDAGRAGDAAHDGRPARRQRAGSSPANHGAPGGGRKPGGRLPRARDRVRPDRHAPRFPARPALRMGRGPECAAASLRRPDELPLS